MRKPSEEENNAWLAHARELDFLNEQENFTLSRFIVEKFEEDLIYVKFITPTPAEEHTGIQLHLKTPPILFDRTPSGEIIIPGRWWASTFERLANHPDAPPEVRQSALNLSRDLDFSDCLLPADTDTIEIQALDHSGNRVPYEALKPGTICVVRVIVT